MKKVKFIEEILKENVFKLGDFFGPYAYDYTVHAHLHLAQKVSKLGSLMCNGFFYF